MCLRSNERLRAMCSKIKNDPEIQQILDDPGMCLILDQMQDEPMAIREYLMEAGIVAIHHI
jgi:hypothetical protein